MKIRQVSVILLLACLSCVRNQAVNQNALIQQQLCIQAIQQNDYINAETRCQLCLEYQETMPECLNGLGLVAYSKNNQQKAIDYFNKALKQNENFAQAKNNLGAIYFQNGNYKNALPLFQAAVREDPGYQDGRYNLALTYLRMGQQALAQGDNATATTNFNLSLSEYQKLVALYPHNANGYLDTGVIYTYLASMSKTQGDAQQNFSQATQNFQQCLQVDQSNQICHQSYGEVLLSQGQYDQALYQFIQCLAGNKNNTVCINGMNSSYQGSQLKSQALSQYIQMLRKNPNDANGHYGYCAALFNNKMDQMAASECQTAISLNPKLCDAYYQLGMYYKRVLNASEAVSSCRQYVLCDLNSVKPNQVTDCQNVITSQGS